MFRLILLFIGLSIVFVSCKKKKEPAYKFHYEYFGLKQGRFIIYDAKEIIHLSDGTSDTLIYQLKTVIGDTVHDNAGRVGYKYLRYKRNSSSDSWNISDVWFTILTENRGELIEENERIVKLVFAPTSDKTWDGNAFNNNPKLEYSYTDVHASQSYNGIYLDSTVTVIQEDVFNLIQWRKKSEVYAKNIGLVKKHYQHLEINNFDINNINTGKELFLTMSSYGVE